ncbi:unnamed protein product [Urochloa decumbens]|uniref:Uncharacterized protein n=1 Tax=Urochloa decumbens TaxID=240449 RepID=A0ABC8XFM8_9POAL
MECSVIIATNWRPCSGSCYLAAPASHPIQECGRLSLPCRRKRHAVLASQRKHTRICAKVGSQQLHRVDAEKRRSNEENYAFFHPSLWGDFFLHYKNTTTPSQQILMEERAMKLKKEVAKMISNSSCSLLQRMHLIYALERLCLDYHFQEEIDCVLAQISKVDFSNHDLHTVALWFYLLRSRSHKVSPDVFAAFKDEEGRFSWQNPRDLLSLYNAAHLRMHGEKILDEAISFTKSELESIVSDLDQQDEPFACEIIRALDIPIPRRVRIYEAKFYISMYEEDNTMDQMIVEFAKLNSNLIQIQHQQELKLLTRWWKNLKLQANFSFSRDRIVEYYFWVVGAYFEPSYSRARVIFTMVMATVVILDDFYDAYATSEECELFTKCIERWDRKEAKDLPENMKLVFGQILDNFETIKHNLAAQEKYHVSYLRNLTVDLVRAYSVEVRWRDEGYVPKTVDEHLQVSAITGACHLLSCASFVGMRDMKKESFDWVSTMPRMVHALCLILRLSDDLKESYEEGGMPLDVASVIESCMKEHSISIESARRKIQDRIEESWKDVNEEWLNPDNNAQPKELLERIFNLTRTMEYMYKQEDALTTSHAVKGTINSLFVESFTNI